MFAVKDVVKPAPVFLMSDSFSVSVSGFGKISVKKGVASLAGSQNAPSFFDAESIVAKSPDARLGDATWNFAGGDQTDVLRGGAGDDTLLGGKGRDFYEGREGKDVFGIYGGKKHLKTIIDFKSGEDTLLLRSDKKSFARWERQGGLFTNITNKKQLLGGKADIIGYNQTNGKVFFYNGKTGKASCIAQLVPGTTLDRKDIQLTIPEK